MDLRNAHIFFKGVLVVWLAAALIFGYFSCLWVGHIVDYITGFWLYGFLAGLAATSIMTGLVCWIGKSIKL